MIVFSYNLLLFYICMPVQQLRMKTTDTSSNTEKEKKVTTTQLQIV